VAALLPRSNFITANQMYRKDHMAALTEEQKQADRKLITEMVIKARAAQEEFEKYIADKKTLESESS